MSGWVYLMANGGMPRHYKIGATRDEPGVRARQLSRHSAVPSAFEVLAAVLVEAPFRAERELHGRYRLVRPNDQREFFVFTRREDLAQAIEAVLSLSGAEKAIRHDEMDYWLGQLPAGGARV